MLSVLFVKYREKLFLRNTDTRTRANSQDIIHIHVGTHSDSYDRQTKDDGRTKEERSEELKSDLTFGKAATKRSKCFGLSFFSLPPVITTYFPE